VISGERRERLLKNRKKEGTSSERG